MNLGTNLELVHSGAPQDEDVLQRYLQASGLREGERIPPERELVKLLGVSRRQVRRLLARLEAEGLVWRGVGRGTFLGGSPSHSADALWQRAGPPQIMQARLALEPAIAATAAFNASPRHLSKIDNCVRKNAEVRSDPEWGLWDCAFHRAIAEATQNPILVAVVEGLGAARGSAEWGDLRRSLVDGDARGQFVSEHRAILAAIRRRDGEQAANAMRGHLRSVDRMLFEGQA